MDKSLLDILEKLEYCLKPDSVESDLCKIEDKLNACINNLSNEDKIKLIKMIITCSVNCEGDDNTIYKIETVPYLCMKILMGSEYGEWRMTCTNLTIEGSPSVDLLEIADIMKKKTVNYIKYILNILIR